MLYKEAKHIGHISANTSCAGNTINEMVITGPTHSNNETINHLLDTKTYLWRFKNSAFTTAAEFISLSWIYWVAGGERKREERREGEGKSEEGEKREEEGERRKEKGEKREEEGERRYNYIGMWTNDSFVHMTINEPTL